MKNVILTHNELQRSLFEAFTLGLAAQQSIPNIHIFGDSAESQFSWRAMEHHTKGKADLDGKLIHQFYISKAVSQMNDVRPWETVAYLNDQAEVFLKFLKEDYEKSH